MTAAATSPVSVGASSAPSTPSRLPPGPIVVAVPGDGGVAPVETAVRLAARTARDVAVASAVELPPLALSPAGVPYVPDVDEYVAAQRERVHHQLAAVDPAASAWPVAVLVDEPARVTLDVARARGASLIVVGAGRHDFAARLFGEVAIRVLRRASCPVLVVGREPMRVPPMIAVAAIDFSPSSVVAASAALDLLGPGGTLHLVHAWMRQIIRSPETDVQDDAYERALPEHFARVERELRDRAADRARDVTIRSAALQGDPVTQLVGFAKSQQADLIAAGRQGHGLLELLIVGRVTTSLLRAANCAVLVTTAPALAERDTPQRALGGTSESRASEEWAALLDAFSRRNAGRRTRLEVDDPALGAQTQETGFTLLGTAYDAHDRRVLLMFGDPVGPTTHLTRAIERVSAVAVESDAIGRDVALRLAHGAGQTLLTFFPDTRGPH